ncbi:MAG: SLC5 family protein [Planctomycetota bacterium]
MRELIWIDYVAMGVFFAVIFGVSGWVSRRRKTQAEFFLAGKRLRWLAIGFSLIAINIGARYVIAFAGVGYRFGTIFGQYEVVSTLNILVLVFVLLPVYRASGIFTMPQLLRKRFGESTHMIFSIVAIVSIFLTVPAGTAVLSKTLEKVTGIDMWVFVAIILPTCLLLTVWGGLTSVAYTDMLMGMIIIGGAALVTYRCLSHESIGGLAGMVEQIQDIEAAEPGLELLSAFRAGGPIPWAAVFTGIFIIGLWFWCIDQTKVQILLGARTLNDGRRGAILLALLKFLAAFVVFVPGLCGRILYPELNDPDSLYGTLLRDLISPGMLGLVIAALSAAVISTLMALLNAAASMFTNDIVKRLVSDETFERRAVLTSRLFVLASVVPALVGVVIYAHNKSVMQLILKCYGLVAGPTLAAYLLGIFWRRATAKAANIALVVGLACSFGAEFLRYLIRIPGLTHARYGIAGFVADYPVWMGSVNHHHRALFAFLLSVLVLMLVSNWTAPPEPERLERTTYAWYRKRRREVEDLAATPDDHEGEPLRDPWYLDYRLWSVVLAAVLLVTWWIFGLPRVWNEFIPAWFGG